MFVSRVADPGKLEFRPFPVRTLRFQR